MSAIRLANRYAKSLLELALEKNELDTISNDVIDMQATINNSNELRALLKSPVIKTEKKESIVKDIFDGKINPVTMTFVNLVVSKKRESHLQDIFAAFRDQYNRYHKITSAKVTTAVAIDDNILSEVQRIVKENTGFEKIDLDSKIDPSLIGGFVLQFEDKLYDCSVKRKLSNLKKSFSS